MSAEAGQGSPFVVSKYDAGHYFIGVIPAKAGIHCADNSLVEKWIPAFERVKELRFDGWL